jgi:Uma2 family endonuclease
MTTLAIRTDAPVLVGPRQGQWTYADWETLPADGNRYEVINGELYMTTAPSFFHQWIVTRLVRYIGIPAEDQRLAYSIAAPIGVLMPGCDPVQPDYVVVLASRASIIRDRRIWGVPDLLVEVLSPSNAAFDEEIKLAAYEAAGVPEYAIIDPRARVLTHYRLDPAGSYLPPRIFTAGETVTFDCLPTLPVPVADLFAGAPDTTL